MIDYLSMAPDKSTAQQTLAEWRAGRLSRDDLYDHAYPAMRQGARRGFAIMMSSAPTAAELDEVTATAFLELERQDKTRVKSISGMAGSIAYRRAQDLVRKRINATKNDLSVVDDRAYEYRTEFADLDAAEAERRFELGDLAAECVQALPPEQRDVVQATVMADESLSDWARQRGKSHQAASRQKERALKAVTRCLAEKTAELARGTEDQADE